MNLQPLYRVREALLDVTATDRPVYDNRRIGVQVDWFSDNFDKCRQYYHSLPGVADWDKEAMDFIKCQYHAQVQRINNERYGK